MKTFLVVAGVLSALALLACCGGLAAWWFVSTPAGPVALERLDGDYERSAFLASVDWASTGRSGSDGQPLDAEALEALGQSVFEITTLRDGREIGSGSGVLLAGSRVVLTNRHVVQHGDAYILALPPRQGRRAEPVYRAVLSAFSTELDFALLRIMADADGNELRRGDLPEPGLRPSLASVRALDPVTVIGYPGIGEGLPVVSRGIVSAIESKESARGDLPLWYRTDAAISPGNSGGAALDASGRLIGLPTWLATEHSTGRQLGSILSARAIHAAIEAREYTTGGWDSIPPEQLAFGGRLQPDSAPLFGQRALQPGFLPDPLLVQATAGGGIDLRHLGPDCVGVASEAPDFRLDWQGSGAMLAFAFMADSDGDATMAVRMPDGSWLCNDDATPSTFDPLVVVEDAPMGTYLIWLGSFEGGLVNGTLAISEVPASLAASLGGASDRLSFTLDPTYGTITLEGGFDSSELRMQAGGRIDASYLGGDCVGFAASAPDLRVQWRGGGGLRISFRADGRGDATLLVNLPDGSWACNDDASLLTTNPRVDLRDAPAGQYDIWVGNFDGPELIPGVLRIVELGRP